MTILPAKFRERTRTRARRGALNKLKACWSSETSWAALAEKEAEIRKFREENPDTQYVIKEVGVRKIINDLGFEQYQ